MSAALWNLNGSKDINRAWENIKQNIKTSAKNSLSLYELKQHKPRFNEERLRFLDQKKQAKMQWLQDRKQSNLDNINNVRCKTSRHFSIKRKEYLEDKIDELDTNSKIKNIGDLFRGKNDFKKVYMRRTNKVKYEKGDLVTYTQSILARWRNHFSHLLNVHGINDVRQTEQPLVPEPSAFRLTWIFKS